MRRIFLLIFQLLHLAPSASLVAHLPDVDLRSGAAEERRRLGGADGLGTLIAQREELVHLVLLEEAALMRILEHPVRHELLEDLPASAHENKK